ncbi:MAG: hypothetical protein WCO79_02625 [bacterium]
MKLKIRIIFSSAIFTLFLLSPFCGIPMAWKAYLAMIFSAITILSTYLLHRQILLSSLLMRKGERITEAYSENGIQHSTHVGA